MQNAELDESQAGIMIAREISTTSDETTLVEESDEELKSLLRVKEEGEKAGLKLNIQKLRSCYPVPSLHGK